MYAKYQKLRCMVFPHLKTISTEWNRLSPDNRAAALVKALPNIPKCHRPEAFGKVTPDSLHWELQDDYMLPFVNLQDLKAKSTFLKFIDTRAHLAPHVFAPTELIFAPYGRVEQFGDRSPLLKMQLNDPSLYGTIIIFTSKAEAIDFEAEGKGLSPIAGLQVLYVQNQLYYFLIEIADHLISTSQKLKGKSIDLKVDPVEPAPLFALARGEPTATNIFDMAAIEPFGLRRDLKLDRLLLLVSPECQRARERVWDPREDPGHFEALFDTARDHDKAQVLDTHDFENPFVKTTQFARVVLQEMVVVPHYMLILWHQLESQLKEIQHRFQANPNGVDVKTMTPVDLVESIQCLEYILGKMKTWVVVELRKFIGSPELREQYRRDPLEDKIIRYDGPSRSTIQGLLCNLLEFLCGSDLNGTGTYDFDDTRYYLDVLGTFLGPGQAVAARKYITAPI